MCVQYSSDLSIASLNAMTTAGGALGATGLYGHDTDFSQTTVVTDNEGRLQTGLSRSPCPGGELMFMQMMRCPASGPCWNGGPYGAPMFHESWQTCNSPTTAMGKGDALQPGQSISSPNGAWRLTYQAADGNLVLYDSAGTPHWALSWVVGYYPTPAPVVATFQSDGNFVVYTTGGQPVWYTGTGGNAFTFQVTNSGQMQVVDAGYNILWHANP
jgi:hypothetical protein